MFRKIFLSTLVLLASSSAFAVSGQIKISMRGKDVAAGQELTIYKMENPVLVNFADAIGNCTLDENFECSIDINMPGLKDGSIAYVLSIETPTPDGADPYIHPPIYYCGSSFGSGPSGMGAWATGIALSSANVSIESNSFFGTSFDMSVIIEDCKAQPVLP